MKDNFEEIIKEFRDKFEDGLWSDADSLAINYRVDVEQFILHALKQQRKKDAEEFERMIGEDEEYFTCTCGYKEGACRHDRKDIRNDLREELRNQLEEWKK